MSPLPSSRPGLTPSTRAHTTSPAPRASSLMRDTRSMVAALTVAAIAAGCSGADNITAPDAASAGTGSVSTRVALSPDAARMSDKKPKKEKNPKNHPGTTAAPAFVYVSDASGTPQLYEFNAGVSTRVTFDNSTDDDPQSAAGRLVFTSFRDGNAEVYIASLDAAVVKRLTTSSAADNEPALDPTGATIVFVSTRSGITRLWTMDSTGANQQPLATGSADFVPERAPVWSPSGAEIAFTSTRSGISQVYVVPAAGGAAVQVTHETGGAFDPSWNGDGTQIIYSAGTSTTVLRSVDLASGTVTSYASSAIAALGQPACTGTICLAVDGAYGPDGDVVLFTGSNTAPTTLVTTTADERSPAILVP